MDKEQLLYNYFANSLSAEEEKQFQNLLETDLEFKKQFDFEKDLKRVVREEEKAKLKSKLQDFEKDISEEKPVIKLNDRSKKRSFNWSIAASVAILFGLGWFGYNTMFGADYDDLYNSNYEEYPNTVYAVTRGDTPQTMVRDAFAAYELGNYQEAIDKFNKIKSEDAIDYLDFYSGQAYLSLGQLENAQKSFKTVISSNSEFSPEALWYLALTSIKKKDKTNAINYLSELVSKYDFKKEKAKELLKELE